MGSVFRSHTRYFKIMSIALLGLLAMGYGCYGRSSGKQLVQKKCINCHTNTIIEISQYTRREWKIIISRMIDYGVKLNNRQLNELVDYLTRAYSPDN